MWRDGIAATIRDERRMDGDGSITDGVKTDGWRMGVMAPTARPLFGGASEMRHLGSLPDISRISPEQLLDEWFEG